MLTVALLAACGPGFLTVDEPAADGAAPPHDEPVLPVLVDTGGDDAPLTGTWLFDTPTPIHVVLDILPEHADRLRERPDEWVPAHVTIAGVAFDVAGVRLKGNGSFQAFDAKPSFKIDLDRFVDDQAIDGIDDLVLDNMGSDPTWMRAHLANRVYRDMGIPAARTTWVRVIEGDRTMVHLLSEDKDKAFLSQWYDDPDGPLYELFDADFHVDDIPLFDHDGGPDDLDAFYELAAILDQPGSRLSVDADHVLDVEQFARYLAVSGVIGQYDAYPFSVPGDDVYFYVDPTDGRIDTLPHGTDETFLDVERPIDFTVGRLGAACLADPTCESWWADAVYDTLDQTSPRLKDILLDEQERLTAFGATGCRDAVEAELAPDPPRTPFNGGGDDDEPHPDAQACSDILDMAHFILYRRDRLSRMPGLPPDD